MSTKHRKNVSNVLLTLSLCLAGALWYYGDSLSKAVHEQEHQNEAWREIIDYSPAAIIVADRQGNIVQWNTGAETLLGWSRAEAESSTLQLIMAPDRYERHEAGFFNAEKREQLHSGIVLQVHGYVMDSSGEVLEVDIRITAVTNGAEFYVAQITRVEELIVEPEPLPPPPQMRYAPPNIQKFRRS